MNQVDFFKKIMVEVSKPMPLFNHKQKPMAKPTYICGECKKYHKWDTRQVTEGTVITIASLKETNLENVSCELCLRCADELEYKYKKYGFKINFV